MNILSHAEPLDADTRLDITHEALIRQWDTLAQWVREEAAQAEAYRRWRDRASAGAELLAGRDLDQAVQWKNGSGSWKPHGGWAERYARRDVDGTPVACEFAETVRLIERSVTSRRRRRRWVVAYLGLGVLVLTMATTLWWQTRSMQWREARRRLVLERTYQAERLREQNPSQGDVLALPHLASAARLSHDADVDISELAADLLTTALSRPHWVPTARTVSVGEVRVGQFDQSAARFMSVARDEVVCIWEASNGHQIACIPEPSKKRRMLSASLSPQGSAVVTGWEDGGAEVWNAEMGTSIVLIAAGSGGSVAADGSRGAIDVSHAVSATAFSSDGRWVATASDDGIAQAWDARSGERVASACTHKRAVLAVAFSPDSKRLVTASEDHTVKIWDFGCRGAPKDLTSEARDLVSVAFSPDGRSVLTLSRAGTAQVWSVDSGSRLGKPFHLDEPIAAVAFSPDGTRVVTASSRVSQLWDSSTGEPAGRAIINIGAPLAVGFGNDGMRALTALGDAVWIWDAVPAAGPTPLQNGDVITAAAFSADGKKLVTASRNGAARIWDAITGDVAGTWDAIGSSRGGDPPGEEILVRAMFAPHDDRILAVSSAGDAWLWNGKAQSRIGVAGEAVSLAAFDADGSTIFADNGRNETQSWDSSGKPVGAKGRYEGRAISTFGPTGLLVTVVGDEVRVQDPWGARKTATLRTLRRSGTLESVDIAGFGAGETRVVIASETEAQVWDLSAMKVLRRLSDGLRINAVAMSLDGSRVVVAGGDVARVWDVETGQLIASLPHRDVKWAAFSDDRRRMVTVSDDDTALVWDVGIVNGDDWSTRTKRLMRIPAIVSMDSGDREHRVRRRRSEATIVASRPTGQGAGVGALLSV